MWSLSIMNVQILYEQYTPCCKRKYTYEHWLIWKIGDSSIGIGRHNTSNGRRSTTHLTNAGLHNYKKATKYA